MVTQEQNRLLLVEDEAIIALAQSRSLRAHGYDVVHVLTGEAAVDAVRADGEIDIVVMDIDLGAGIDGAEAADRILTLRELPIVFLSSHTERAMVDRVKRITNYGYVVKQSSDFVLVESIESALKLFRTTQRAREQERRYRALFASIRDAIVVTDHQRRIVEVNPAFTEVFGYGMDEVREHPTRLLFAGDDEYERLGRELNAMDGTGGLLNTFRYRRKDGREFVGEKRVQYLVDDQGSRVGLIGLIRDVTNRAGREAP